MIECVIIIYANNKHDIKNELDVVDENWVEKYIRLVTECFYQYHLIIVKLFHFEHIFNKIESFFKSFIHITLAVAMFVICINYNYTFARA